MKRLGSIRLLLVLSFLAVTSHAAAVNVIEFGAKGNGTDDDSDAIKRAVAKITEQGGGPIFFPAGKYRIAKHGPGVHFTGVSNVLIHFEPGAVLLMDNLLPDGKGGGSGIIITGPGRNITLENVTVEWAKPPSARSNGDGFRFEGFPSDEGTIEGISMLNCTARRSAQTGAVFMGCSDVMVANFRPVDTGGDGLHFNACRRVNVAGETGINNGDDTLAFVTYYSDPARGKRGTIFAFPALNEWCNSSSNATNIVAIGGKADGVRISGSEDVNLSNVSVRGKWGVQLDAAQSSANANVHWSYLASRGINLENVTLENCSHGLVVRGLNIGPDAPPAQWLFDVQVRNLSVRGSAQLGVDVQSVGGVSIEGLLTDSKVRFQNARGAYRLSEATIRGSGLEITGVVGSKVTAFGPNYELPPLAMSSAAEVADAEIDLSHLLIQDGQLQVDSVSGVTGEDITVSAGSATIRHTRNSRFTGLQVKGKDNGKPVLLEDVPLVEFTDCEMQTAGGTEEPIKEPVSNAEPNPPAK